MDIPAITARSRLALGSGLVIALVFLGLSLGAGETRQLVSDSNQSTIQFSVQISEGLTPITGKFNEFSIDVNLVDNDITKSRISTVIKVQSVSTGMAALDEDLRSKDFFDTQRFPEITFVSDRIERKGEEFVAHGLFQMHGVEKMLSLPFRITGQKGGDVIGFSSRYTLKRSDFGVGTAWKDTQDVNSIGDEIDLEIDFWTKKPKVNK